jgi:hypothetical protein
MRVVAKAMSERQSVRTLDRDAGLVTVIEKLTRDVVSLLGDAEARALPLNVKQLAELQTLQLNRRGLAGKRAS